MLAEAADVNGIYEEALDSLRAAKFADVANARGGAKTKQGTRGKKPSKVMSEREKEQAAIDYYANVRTNVLLTWVLSNVSGKFLGDVIVWSPPSVLTNVWKTQGMLLLLILSGTNSSSTFSPDAGVSRTKGYLMFILAFAAITNIVVSFILCLRKRRSAN
ncbi:hypothetical protein J3R82DRAFT_10643 [Butyriboletus roseoflavus]|nr:hypothetical protein J3R82DRAFT_10643 [Butyriboletus roseoflavus]